LDLSAFVDSNNNHRCLVARKDFPEHASLASPERKQNSCSESHVYDLYAVCSHSGSLQSGHYIGISLIMIAIIIIKQEIIKITRS